jgi:hypothetical protein
MAVLFFFGLVLLVALLVAGSDYRAFQKEKESRRGSVTRMEEADMCYIVWYFYILRFVRFGKIH